uniref:Protein kinase domain-containing protein n=1 Tax=Setaria digitata TaxID=48799 RepID=A0A915Q3H5_9BILA
MIRTTNTDEGNQRKADYNANDNSIRKLIDEKCDLTKVRDKFVISTNSTVYRLEKYLGKGGYGEVYECFSEATKKIYALKKENILRTKISKEIEVLKRASQCDCKQICKYVDDGRQEDYVFVVMTLLGKDLSKLRRETRTKNFSLNTSLRVGLLTLSAIRELHGISVVSRAFSSEEIAEIYRMDQFYQQGVTLAFVERHDMLHYEHIKNLNLESRRDDLESWVYVMVELSSGTLPWKTPRMMKQKKKKLKEEVYRAKLRIRLGEQRKQFFRNSLPILDYIFMMIDGLALEADPPYEQIQYMFEKLMLEADVKWDDIYDWEESTKSKQSMSADGATSTSAAMVTYSKPRPVLFRIAATTPTASTESSSLPNI